MTETVVIVGAGPAGMSAAIAAAELGLSVVLVDDNPQPGGQIYRVPELPRTKDDTATDRGSQLRRQLDKYRSQIDVRCGTRVWGVFGPGKLATITPDGCGEIAADRLILAPGAYEFVPPFPGWTLPGVMTPGAAQLMVKSMGVRPGRRVLIAGTGPFLLVVAAALHAAGVKVVAVAETVARADALHRVPKMAKHPKLLLQGFQLLRQLRKAKIPVLTKHVVVSAEGEGELTAATIAPCDDDWRPQRGSAKTYEVDTLCVGYGFVPRMQLAQLAGCELEYRDELGGWIPQVDEFGRTSQPSVWSIGDGAGVAGALVAELEGRLAGFSVAQASQSITREDLMSQTRGLRRRLQKVRAFRGILDDLSRIRPGLHELAAEDTVLCRCEELTRCEVDEGVAAGNCELRSLKVATRLGMGPCQGRMCWPNAARRIASETGQPIVELGPISVRNPIDSVSLSELAGMRGPA